MKKLIIALLALGCMACNDEAKVQETIGSTLLIAKSGVQTLSYKADATSATYKVYVYRSGYNDGTSKCSLYVDQEALTNYNTKKGTAYQLMPTGSYTLPTNSFMVTNDHFLHSMEITIQLSTLPVGDYVLPVSIKSEDKTPVSAENMTVLIHPQEEAE